MGRDINITPQTAKRWLAVLEAGFQWYELPAWHGNTVKRLSGRPKGYLADTGLACHLTRITSPDALGGHPLTGALFETAVMGEIRKRIATLSRKPAMYHWRVHQAGEVDLILERDGCLYPIEIKLTSRPAKKDTRGLQSFRKTYPKQQVAPGLILAPTDDFERITLEDFAVPWDLV